MNRINKKPSCDDEQESDLLTVSQALKHMLNTVEEKNSLELIHLSTAVDRVLGKPIVSSIHVPSHCNSAVDGYAIRSVDLPHHGEIIHLPIVALVVAGHPYHGSLNSGECVQIMTGAQMPDSADTVIMQEHVELEGNRIRIDASHTPGQNVRQAGEDIQTGQVVLEAGTQLTPPQIGLIASLGVAEITVKTCLTAAVFSTGDEVLGLGHPPREGCIYDSNRYSLMAALKMLGCHVLDLGIIPDDPEQLQQVFSLSAKSADIIFTSGGVSVGSADYTKQVLSKTGSINFWKVAMKPGRPIAFGKINDTIFFGLPGNPVAVMVTFYQFALPCLQKMMGVSHPLISPLIQARCRQPIRKLAGRTEFQRGILSKGASGQWQVSTTGQQGSGVLRSMSEANAFIILKHDQSSIEEGEWVTVQPFSGLF